MSILSRTTRRVTARALPWGPVLQALVLIGKRLGALSRKDRARAAALLRQSRGRPGNLTAGERQELRKLAGKLDLKDLARELSPLARRGRGRRRGR